MNGKRSKQIRRAAARAGASDKEAKRAYYAARHPDQSSPLRTGGFFMARRHRKGEKQKKLDANRHTE